MPMMEVVGLADRCGTPSPVPSAGFGEAAVFGLKMPEEM
jgi:hypothetical protein